MTATVYACSPGLRIVPLDGLTLVYHPESGQTHFVATPVPELLSALAESPADARALLQRLARFYVIEADAEQVEEHLRALNALGVVGRA